jgi:hypothetical protein
LELQVLAVVALIIFWHGWPGWGAVLFWVIVYFPMRVLAHRMARAVTA